MTMMRNTLVLLGALSCLAPTHPATAAEGCPDLEGKDTAAHLEYLRGDRSKLATKCIVEAINYVGAKRYPPASQVLVQYLDYHEPDYFRQLPLRLAPDAIYPAIGALYRLGRQVVPELTAAISDASTSDLVRQNAADTIFLMYGPNNPEGIAVLVRAAHAQTDDPTASIRLMDQARRLARKCGITARNDCENAVLK